jgi:hypothetical protein
LGLSGLALSTGPLWFQALGFIPPVLQLLGWLMLFIAVLSGTGIGPWGRYYSSLVVSDRASYLKTLEPKQPWQ